jgi:uncharacterized membrane protein YidH (DUF202 family)
MAIDDDVDDVDEEDVRATKLFKQLRDTTPLVIVVFGIVFAAFVYGFTHLDNIGNEFESSSNSSPILKIVLLVLLSCVSIVYGFQYYNKHSITNSIKGIFNFKDSSESSESSESSNSTSILPIFSAAKEVFHIPRNIYTYHNAKAVCKAFDSELATYQQIEETYTDGGEFCGYGWSKDQLALYPTQLETYNKLKKDPDTKHNCGRPGVNGGYISNKNALFGANCYGVKPDQTQLEKTLSKTHSVTSHTTKQLKFNKLVDKFKDIKSDIVIAPFNYEKWAIM